MKPKKTLQASASKGFALIVTLTLMVLLSILALGMLSLSSVALRSSDVTSAAATARANARMALEIAISELQVSAGPDQRISARADILGEASPNPAWTAVWNTAGGKPAFLVSGNKQYGLDLGSVPDSYPAGYLAHDQALSDADSIALFKPGIASTDKKEIRAPLVQVAGSPLDGSYAWWVGDEGVKARVDLNPEQNNLTGAERLAHSRSPLAPGLGNIGGSLTPDKFGVSGTVNKKLLVSMETVGLAADDLGLPREYFDDLTVGGFGIPANVKDGGLKTDLSLVFDRSQKDQPFVAEALGATPSQATENGSTYYTFAVADPDTFYLSEEIASNIPAGVGPNWGTLFNYGRLWESTTGGNIGLLPPNPRLATDISMPNWNPYMGAGVSAVRDVQHTNSSVAPVVSLLQIGIYLGAKPGPPREDGSKRYQVQLHIKPILGLWNPYDIPIRAAPYQFEWAIAPFVRMDFRQPEANGSFKKGNDNVTDMWLRDYWKIGNKLPSGGTGDGSYFRLRTPPIDFQPGEFRLFAVEANPEIASDANDSNLLVPTLDNAGSFVIDVLRSRDKPNPSTDGAPTSPTEDRRGMPLLIGEGFWGWAGETHLQDTNFQDTKSRYSGLNLDAAKSWVRLQAYDGTQNLSNFTDIWNGGRFHLEASKPFIPEPLLSARDTLNTSAETGKSPYKIEDMAGGQPGHLGTWRFQLRNPTEIDSAGQGLRGWVDSNPVTLASNVRLDGSKNTAAGVEGWNAPSHFIAGAHRTGAIAGTVGDGFGGNRGLISEGAYKHPTTPQGPGPPIVPGRWQGLGGAGSTTANGFSHVLVYDVPRAPLVSIGQFQNAQLSRYNFEPGFVVGNSYANPRIPLDSVAKDNFAGMSGVKIVDTPHQVNERLWDEFFFSTLGLDYIGETSGTFDNTFGFENLTTGAKILPNPRMVFSPINGDTSIDEIISDAGAQAPQAISARIAVSGAFNINSTSVPAWMAFLSSMENSEFPTVDPVSGAVSWQDDGGVRLSRFGHPITPDSTDAKSREAAFWQGWRELDNTELKELAEAIVSEVRSRGPFRSFADFVNRDPDSEDIDHQRKGALQAALDLVLNNKLPADIGNKADSPTGSQFSDAISATENQAAGHASYLMQGDVLQNLSPLMQARSDYFRIRSYGEAKDRNGNVIARAWCEAFVQRSSGYIDPADTPETAVSDLVSNANVKMGRKFEVVRFRWLSEDEI